MSNVHYCVKEWLVALNEQLPSDPTVAYSGTPPIIGCSHLVCDACHAVVRHVEGRSRTNKYPPIETKMVALYESAEPENSPLFFNRTIDAGARAYFCRCDWYSLISSASWLAMLDQPWRCGGHPMAADDPKP